MLNLESAGIANSRPTPHPARGFSLSNEETPSCNYTIETTYHLPVYRQGTYEAESLAEACRLAVEDDDWDDDTQDHETAGETYVSGIWSGADSAYEGEALPIPATSRRQFSARPIISAN